MTKNELEWMFSRSNCVVAELMREHDGKLFENIGSELKELKKLGQLRQKINEEDN